MSKYTLCLTEPYFSYFHGAMENRNSFNNLNGFVFMSRNI